MTFASSTRLWIWSALLTAFLQAGCGGGSHSDTVTPDGTATQGRLTTIAWLYTLHLQLKGRAPEKYEELRRFAETLPAAHGGPASLSERFLISPRDSKPLVIRYGLRPDPARGFGSKTPPGGKIPDGPVVAHEQEGVGGRRFVVYGGSARVEQVDEARWKELVR